jgi:hypothetical protein
LKFGELLIEKWETHQKIKAPTNCWGYKLSQMIEGQPSIKKKGWMGCA